MPGFHRSGDLSFGHPEEACSFGAGISLGQENEHELHHLLRCSPLAEENARWQCSGCLSGGSLIDLYEVAFWPFGIHMPLSLFSLNQPQPGCQCRVTLDPLPSPPHPQVPGTCT